MTDEAPEKKAQQVFDRAAEFFGVLSTPVRLRIIGALCGGEQNVSYLLGEIEVSQPNLSRHLSVMYHAGVVAKRRSGAHMFYRLADESVVQVCKAVCSQIALEAQEAHPRQGKGSASSAMK